MNRKSLLFVGLGVLALAVLVQGIPPMRLSTLATFNGQNGMPAYIAISGKIYDVTAGKDQMFVKHVLGKDGTMAYAQGCFTDACFEHKELSEEELGKLEKWMAYFHNTYEHEYQLVADSNFDHFNEIHNKEVAAAGAEEDKKEL